VGKFRNIVLGMPYKKIKLYDFFLHLIKYYKTTIVRQEHRGFRKSYKGE